MSKCRPDCCSPSSSDPGFGLIVLALIIIGGAIAIIRAVAHAVETVLPVVVEVLKTAGITAGSIAAVIVTVLVIRKLVRWHLRHRQAAAARQVIVTPESPALAPPPSFGRAELTTDAAQIFAEAVASDMDPRFIERIVTSAFDRRET
jgi:hypothetical protein